MDPYNIIRIIVFSIPVYSAITCGMLFFVAYRQKMSLTENRLRRLLVYYYTVMALMWLAVIIMAYFPQVFVSLSPVYYLGTMLLQVIFYHFIFIVTCTRKNQRFSPWHYYIPILTYNIVLVVSLFIPAVGDLPDTSHYKGYMHLFSSQNIAHILFLYTTLYIVLTICSLYRYRKAVILQRGMDGWRPVRWLVVVTGMKIFLWLSSFLTTYLVVEAFTSFSSLPTMIVLAIQQVIIVYNLIRGNYILLIPDRIVAKRQELLDKNQMARRQADIQKKHSEALQRPGSWELTKKNFEEYLKKHKPYLSPELTIADLSATFMTNRSYLSAFINKTYGINFKTYINMCRLRELNRLMRLPASSDKDMNKLIHQAGFGSIRNYHRVIRKMGKNDDSAGIRKSSHDK
ncbi:MAG: hypothetical protein LBT43_08485 [Prevotella sp.]|jgi:AraC-like DNA-binding protein|nr:hypothetical protein [Prevotella sp.]